VSAEQLGKVRAALDAGLYDEAMSELWAAYGEAGAADDLEVLHQVLVLAERIEYDARAAEKHEEATRLRGLVEAALRRERARPGTLDALSGGAESEHWERPTSFWVAIAGGGGMIIGGFGPWARALFVSVSGAEGDGWFLIIGGGLTVLMVVAWGKSRGQARAILMLPLLAGVVGFAVVIYDYNSLADVQTDESGLLGGVDLVSPGWGLILCGVASVVAVVACISLLLTPKQKTR